MQDWAVAFYKGMAWKRTRNAYAKARHGQCERCGKAGMIVHHRIHLNQMNINIPGIALDWKNLELVCRDCHGIEHEGVSPCESGLSFDAQGNLIEGKSRRNGEGHGYEEEERQPPFAEGG